MDRPTSVPHPPDDSVPADRGEGPLRVCLISLGGELFAIELQHVREVFQVEAMTAVPGMPTALVGVANLRGIVMPLVDLRRLLGLPEAGPSPQFAVVIRHGSDQVGLLVDQVPELRTVPRDAMLASPPGDAAGRRSFVSAVLRVENRMGGVVEVPTLLAHVETGST
ncbi:MAG: chemotaxis protein CheW [Nitrospirota bacterium]